MMKQAKRVSWEVAIAGTVGLLVYVGMSIASDLVLLNADLVLLGGSR